MEVMANKHANRARDEAAASRGATPSPDRAAPPPRQNSPAVTQRADNLRMKFIGRSGSPAAGAPRLSPALPQRRPAPRPKTNGTPTSTNGWPEGAQPEPEPEPEPAPEATCEGTAGPLAGPAYEVGSQQQQLERAAPARAGPSGEEGVAFVERDPAAAVPNAPARIPQRTGSGSGSRVPARAPPARRAPPSIRRGEAEAVGQKHLAAASSPVAEAAPGVSHRPSVVVSQQAH